MLRWMARNLVVREDANGNVAPDKSKAAPRRKDGSKPGARSAQPKVHRKLIEDLMIERMGENDKIVTRYMADQQFQGSAFPILAREIFEAVRSRAPESFNTGLGPTTQG